MLGQATEPPKLSPSALGTVVPALEGKAQILSQAPEQKTRAFL